jgi:hypothetical protein
VSYLITTVEPSFSAKERAVSELSGLSGNEIIFSPLSKDKVNDEIDGFTGGGWPLRETKSFVRIASALTIKSFVTGTAFVGMLTLERLFVKIASSLFMKSLVSVAACVGILTVDKFFVRTASSLFMKSFVTGIACVGILTLCKLVSKIASASVIFISANAAFTKSIDAENRIKNKKSVFIAFIFYPRVANTKSSSRILSF